MSLEEIVFVYSNNLSARVLLPWSMCAMMQKFRICFIIYGANITFVSAALFNNFNKIIAP
jgi:hypothetical protein